MQFKLKKVWCGKVAMKKKYSSLEDDNWSTVGKKKRCLIERSARKTAKRCKIKFLDATTACRWILPLLLFFVLYHPSLSLVSFSKRESPQYINTSPKHWERTKSCLQEGPSTFFPLVCKFITPQENSANPSKYWSLVLQLALTKACSIPTTLQTSAFRGDVSPH